jgi:protein tyrosine/serine phosphatase
MEVNQDPVELKFDEEIPDLELVIKIEKVDDEKNIKTEFSEQKNNFKPLQIIGEKRKNQEISNLDDKKIKEEVGVFEELDYNQELHKINENNFCDFNNQVIKIRYKFKTN